MINKIEKIVSSELETMDFAKELSTKITEGDIVLLEGNLGAGKTFIVKAICKQWGIEEVSSPTFALVNDYMGERHVYHFDFYRIEREEELFDIGFDEYLADEDSVKFIEWPYLFPNLLPKRYLKISIELKDKNRVIIAERVK